MYDAFISYKSEHHRWTSILAKNLRSHGLDPFLDTENIDERPITTLASGIHGAIESSKNGIIVITANALTSSWVELEYNQMLVERAKRPTFQIIPVYLGREAALPFVRAFSGIDFRESTNYSSAFRSLLLRLCPDARPDEEKLEIPSYENEGAAHTSPDTNANANGATFFDTITQHLELDPVILLAPEDRLDNAQIERLFRELHRRYAHKNILTMVPLFSPNSTTQEYFEALSDQCGLESVASTPARFERNLHSAFSSDEDYLLVINGLESGAPAHSNELAGILRNIHRSFRRTVHLLLLGGHKLVDMALAGDGNSPLDFAMPVEWPESDLSTVELLKDSMYPELQLDARASEAIFRATGGHPKLVQLCLHEVASATQPADISQHDLEEIIERHPYTIRMYRPLRSKVKFHRSLARYTRGDDVAPIDARDSSPIISTLYWKNLLRQAKVGTQTRLVWRCAPIRRVGARLFGDQ